MGRCVHVTTTCSAPWAEPGMFVELSTTVLARQFMNVNNKLAEVLWVNRRTVDVRILATGRDHRLPIEALLWEVSGRY